MCITPECICIHDSIYGSLLRYFLPELSETEFRPDAAAGDERFPVSQYLAKLLFYDPHYSEIIRRITPTQKVCGDE